MPFLYDTLRKIWQDAAAFNDKVFRHGCDFSRWVTADSIGFSPERGNQYQPSSGNMVNVLRRYAITKSDAVLDIGCGKGKVMYLLSHFPFGKIDGIDLSPQLVKIANDNFLVWGARAATPLRRTPPTLTAMTTTTTFICSTPCRKRCWSRPCIISRKASAAGRAAVFWSTPTPYVPMCWRKAPFSRWHIHTSRFLLGRRAAAMRPTPSPPYPNIDKLLPARYS